MKKQIAFTLAEVLITLGVIGIVAALTIPTLINSYQKHQYVTQLKKAYTEFNQALLEITANEGAIGDIRSTGLFVDSGDGSAVQRFGDEITKYIKTSKNCGTAANLKCMPRLAAQNYDGTQGSPIPLDNGIGPYKFISLDGAGFYMSTGNDNCVTNWSRGKTGNMKQVCGQIYIDVNGPTKGPSVMGRDVFYFFLTNGHGPLLYPAGGVDDMAWGWWKDSACIDTNRRGEYCTARVMEEGWNMNY